MPAPISSSGLGAVTEQKDSVWVLPRGLRIRHGGPVAVMGILNVTPDSFSDGGQYFDPAEALAHADRLVSDGSDLLDVGGESTRPGHVPVPVEEEWTRLARVIEGLRTTPRPLSVDTRHAEVARRAVLAGCEVVNDVTGLEDPAMAEAVAETGAAVIIGHWSANELTASDVLGRVIDDLGKSVEKAIRAGVKPWRIAVDPGFGFAKNADANWELLRGLQGVARLGRALVVGVSRKRFLTALAGPELEARDRATATASALCVLHGADVVRVHAPRPTALAVRVAERLCGRKAGG